MKESLLSNNKNSMKLGMQIRMSERDVLVESWLECSQSGR